MDSTALPLRNKVQKLWGSRAVHSELEFMKNPAFHTSVDNIIGLNQEGPPSKIQAMIMVSRYLLHHGVYNPKKDIAQSGFWLPSILPGHYSEWSAVIATKSH